MTVIPSAGTGRVTRARKEASEEGKGKAAVAEEMTGKRKRALTDDTQK